MVMTMKFSYLRKPGLLSSVIQLPPSLTQKVFTGHFSKPPHMPATLVGFLSPPFAIAHTSGDYLMMDLGISNGFHSALQKHADVWNRENGLIRVDGPAQDLPLAIDLLQDILSFTEDLLGLWLVPATT